MSYNKNHKDWQIQYAQERAQNHILEEDDNSSNHTFDFDQQLRDSHNTQYQTYNHEDVTKGPQTYISAASNGETTYLDSNVKTTGLETMIALDNAEVGNAALAYVVGRYEQVPSTPRTQLRESLTDNKSKNSHRFSYYNSKTPSTSNFSNNDIMGELQQAQNPKNPSSSSDMTVSTHVLFDSPDSDKTEKNRYANHSSSSGSEKRKQIAMDEKFVEAKKEVSPGFYRNYNVTKPLPPQSQPNTNIMPQGKFDNTDVKEEPRRSLSNSDKSVTSNNSTNPLLSMKLQKASQQRKTQKGYVLNPKHMSIYQYQQPKDGSKNDEPVSQEVHISKERLMSILNLSIISNLCGKYVLLCAFVPIIGPILAIFLDNATFLKICICKEKTLQNIDYIEENPYSSSQSGFYNGYGTREIGYFGIVSLWLEHEITSSIAMKSTKREVEKEADVNREKKVGFRETASVINYPINIPDPICVDVDYTRLKYYLNTLHHSDEQIQSEFLRTCLKEWSSFLRTVKVLTFLYFAIWLILSILCIVLILLFGK